MTLRKHTHLLFIAAILTLLSSCQKQSPAPAAEQSEVINNAPTLTLDDGKKWQVDTHTRQSMQSLSSLVEQSPPEKLAQAMAGGINTLFEGCTMSGPAHDQLHIILTDMLSQVNGLYSTTTPEERNTEIQNIKKTLQTYHTHFE
ncbi:MAG: hypothetical protein L3J39_02680 [Verrucomicrobiales bacterium]|nr:hypothetical protein [Verrucomicrobiales bacterium]